MLFVLYFNGTKRFFSWKYLNMKTATYCWIRNNILLKYAFMAFINIWYEIINFDFISGKQILNILFLYEK